MFQYLPPSFLGVLFLGGGRIIGLLSWPNDIPISGGVLDGDSFSLPGAFGLGRGEDGSLGGAGGGSDSWWCSILGGAGGGRDPEGPPGTETPKGLRGRSTGSRRGLVPSRAMAIQRRGLASLP